MKTILVREIFFLTLHESLVASCVTNIVYFPISFIFLLINFLCFILCRCCTSVKKKNGKRKLINTTISSTVSRWV